MPTGHFYGNDERGFMGDPFHSVKLQPSRSRPKGRSGMQAPPRTYQEIKTCSRELEHLRCYCRRPLFCTPRLHPHRRAMTGGTRGTATIRIAPTTATTTEAATVVNGASTS